MTTILNRVPLSSPVFDRDLCTHCGACIDLCPYLGDYRDQTTALHSCNRNEGICLAVCPRVYTNLVTLRKSLFDPNSLTPELGPLEAYWVSHATESSARYKAQHGGTVTALIEWALESNAIDAAVLCDEIEPLVPAGVIVTNAEDVVEFGGSHFVATSMVSTFHRAVREGAERIGIVATPCQALALAKLRTHPEEELWQAGQKIGLVIGLFCGWAFSWRSLRDTLAREMDIEEIVSMDVPPSSHQVLKVYTKEGEKDVPLERVRHCIRKSCRYCFDMTAEFADISVGGARLPDGWEVSKNWNQLIVRSKKGLGVVNSAYEAGRLELRDPPKGGLEKVKAAAAKRKRDAIASLIQVSGDSKNWLYLPSDDPLFAACLQSDTEEK